MNRLLTALLLLAVPASGQIVEKARTFADLTSSHPCSSGLAGRHAIVTDCDAADDIGDGGGSFSCFARCDGTAPWETVAIGGGGGGGLSDGDYGDVAVSGSGTVLTVEAMRNSAVAVAATTGNLQWEGATADGFEGNFTFADPTADWTWAWGATGTLTAPSGGLLDMNAGTIKVGNLSFLNGEANNMNVYAAADLSAWGGLKSADFRLYSYATKAVQKFALLSNGDGVPEIDIANSGCVKFTAHATSAEASIDAGMCREAAGLLEFNDGTTGGGGIHLNPMASPPRTCDATAEGDIYSDTSHALCWCDASAWQKLSGAGTCA